MYSLMVFMYKFYKHANQQHCIHPCLVRNLEVVQAILSRKVFNVNNCFQCVEGDEQQEIVLRHQEAVSAPGLMSRMHRYHSPARSLALDHELRGPGSFFCHSSKHHQPAELAQKGGQLLSLSSLMQVSNNTYYYKITLISKCRNKGVGQIAWKLPVPQVKQRAGKDGTGLTDLQEGFPPKSRQ